jgi:LacI family transcriptional regulator
MSVVGFDDVLDAQTKIPGGLTTVRQDFRRIGETAVQQLNKMIDGATGEESRVILPTKLIIRNSTAECKSK